MRIFRSQRIYNKWALIVFLCVNPWVSLGAGETDAKTCDCSDDSHVSIHCDTEQFAADVHIADVDCDGNCDSESRDEGCCPEGCASSCGLACCGLICVLDQKPLFLIEQATCRPEFTLKSHHGMYCFDIFHPPEI